MADSIYKQAADEVASQVKTLADAIDATLTPEATIPVGWLDWDDVQRELVTVRLVEDAEIDDFADWLPDGTNDRDIYAYPVIVLFALPRRSHWDTRRNNIHKLKQSIRDYYNQRRRMSGVSETNVNELPVLVSDKAVRPPREISTEKDVHGMTIWCRFLQPRQA